MTQSLSILLVEDEPLIAMMMEDIVDALGHRVAGSADTIPAALALVEEGGFDLAILDVRISDGASWPIADALADRAIPYMLATGGHVEPPPVRHADAPVLNKPFTLDGLRDKLAEVAPAA